MQSPANTTFENEPVIASPRLLVRGSSTSYRRRDTLQEVLRNAGDGKVADRKPMPLNTLNRAETLRRVS